MADIEWYCKRLEEAKARRSNWDTIFQEIADRVLPQAADFNSRREDGASRTELMFDATASLSAAKFAAVMESFNSPRNSQWHKLTVSDRSLAKQQRVKAWLDEATAILFDARYSPRAGFAGQSGEVYLNLGVFGTAGLFIDADLAQRTLRYKTLSLANTWFMENMHGRIDTVFREFRWTLRQIEQRWPGQMPQKLAEKLEKKPDERACVVHVTSPATDYEPGAMNYRGKPFRSCYFLPDEKHKLEEGGFTSWPFPCARYMTSVDEVYGRSPAWLALSSIKVLNEQKKTVLKAGHRAVDPPLLASEDGILSAFNMQPGAINYGGIDSQGRPTVQPLMTGTRVDIGKDLMDDERRIISEGFLIDLFKVLAENPTMTATQAMELVQERASLLSPIGGRLQSEWFGPQIEREVDLLQQAGQLPPLPPELIEANGEYEIEYTSPMARAARASEGVAIIRSLEAITPLAQVDPGILDGIKLDEIPAELWEINGAPIKLLRTPEELAAMREGKAQQEQAAQLLAAAPVVSETATNLVNLQKSYGTPVQ